MKWMRENSAKLCVIAAIVFFLITASTSSYGIGNFESNDPSAAQTVQTAAAAIQKPFSKGLRGVGDFFNDLIHFRQYSKENSKLKEENAQLKKELREARLNAEQMQELEQISNALVYIGAAENYQPVSADVVSLDESGIYGTLTVSVGSRNGVQVGDAVIGPSGMIGRVSSATQRSAKVSGIINTSTSVSFCVSGTETTIGIVTGDGKDGLTGYLLDNKKKIKEGSVLVTSGLGRYPSGIEIGTVSGVSKDKSTGQVSIQAKPSADFYSSGIVTVLTGK